MDADDLEPKRPSLDNPKDLEVLSIEALGEYITELEAEIDRGPAPPSPPKRAAKGAADAFFKN